MADQRYLKVRGIASNTPQGSTVERPEEIEPYASRRGSNRMELAYWCVPESVEAAYRDAGVRRLYPWQAECLGGPGVLDGRPLVYVAPTSAGKSLVAEVLMLRQLLFRGRRALLVLPYVSICVEKVEQLRRLWGGCGVRVEALYGASDGQWHSGADVAVCTIEKANALLNRLLEDDALLRDLGVIAIDEMHLLGEEHRGYMLELILVKARLSAAKVLPTEAAGALQIIGLSATLPNVGMLADWLGAHLFISTDRPVPLSLSVASRGRVLGAPDCAPPTPGELAPPPLPMRARDPDGLVPLVWECIAAGHAALVFCATKDWCEKAATMLAEELPAEEGGGSRADARLCVVEELKQVPSGLCPVLARTVPQGVAYHHSGLTVEERAVLEGAFRRGIISCICATSTLAAGVNLPARRVIIRSMRVGTDPLDPVRFRQMAGRAGRTGLDLEGECVVLTRSDREATEARALFSAELAPVRSSLHGQRLVRAVLEVVSLGLVRTAAALEGPFARSLLRYQEERDEGGVSSGAGDGAGSTAKEADRPEPDALVGDIRAALRYLQDQCLVRVDDLGAMQAQPLPSAATIAGAAGADRAAGPAEAAGVASIAGSSGTGRAGASFSTVFGGEPAAGDAGAGNAVAGAGSVFAPGASLLATPLGDGVVHSALRPVEALSVFEDLQRARTGIRLDTDLHLVFLATPMTAGIEPDWHRFLAIYERLPARERAVASAVGVSPEFLVQQTLGRRGPVCVGGSKRPGGDWRLERERMEALHRRFWAALALHQLASEVPAARVAAAYKVPRGALQSLQALAATYCSMVRHLCQRLRWHEMAAIFDAIVPRLSFGVSAEALPLCQIPGVYPVRARALLDGGFTTVEALARAPTSAVEAVLRRLSQFESHRTDIQAANRQEAVVRQAAQRIVRGAQERLGAQLQQLEDEAEDERRRLLRATAAAHPEGAATTLLENASAP